jgi:hypothetical protein
MLPINPAPSDRTQTDSNPATSNIHGRSLSPEQIQKISDFVVSEANKSAEDTKYESAKQALLDKRESYLEQLSPTNDTRWGGPLLDHNELDRLIGACLARNQDGEFDQVIRAACEAHLREPISRQSWNHSVCHNFEKYPSGLLSSDKFLDLANRLVEQGAERALQGEGCFDRIIGGVIKYNLDRLDSVSIHSAFRFKPECLNNPEVQAMLDGNEYTRWILDFVQATTPYSYLMREVEDALAKAESEEVYASVSFEQLLLIRNEENSSRIDAYIARAYSEKKDNISATEAWAGYTSAVKKEVVPGVFVDVEGTLLVGEYFKEEREVRTVLNKQLAQALDALCPSSEEVIIFTGGDTVALTEQLRSFGFPERFLPVRSKADFRGQNLQILIDDTKPQMQGFHAEAHIRPKSYDSSAIEEFKELDPQGALAQFKLSSEGPVGEASSS